MIMNHDKFGKTAIIIEIVKWCKNVCMFFQYKNAWRLSLVLMKKLTNC